MPKVSVVVASYNGGRTLQMCLESLGRLHYPDYEVIVVDDGSTDGTPDIVQRFPDVRFLRQNHEGLSCARNAGIRAATGDIVAFTDDDCRADEDWLRCLINDLLQGDFAGIGGHNFLPPEDSFIAAAVAASPGGPAHVMLTDREAEHIPGCNMAFYKWALEQIGMFDPVFRQAGDDVDICWRLRDAHLKIGFSPGGFVWHCRRSTVKAYLKQQTGYGEAEALLTRKHPEHFNSVGGGIWRGRIYSSSYGGLLLRGPVIYRGVFGSGFFQRLYTPDPVQPLLLCTSLGYHVCINVPLLLLACYFEPFVPIAAASFGISVGACVLAAAQARLPRSQQCVWSRPLVGLLFFLQPVVRGWARFKGRSTLQSLRNAGRQEPAPFIGGDIIPEHRVYWCGGGGNRYRFLKALPSKLAPLGWVVRADTGWSDHDLEILAHLWTRLELTTVTEELGQGKWNLRCRVRGVWSGAAKLFCAGVLSVILLVLALARTDPWMWLILVLLPLAWWWMEDEREENERLLAFALDAVAREQDLLKLDLQDSEPAPVSKLTRCSESTPTEAGESCGWTHQPGVPSTPL